jgi:hypothetical protein
MDFKTVVLLEICDTDISIENKILLSQWAVTSNSYKNKILLLVLFNNNREREINHLNVFSIYPFSCVVCKYEDKGNGFYRVTFDENNTYKYTNDNCENYNELFVSIRKKNKSTCIKMYN